MASWQGSAPINTANVAIVNGAQVNLVPIIASTPSSTPVGMVSGTTTIIYTDTVTYPAGDYVVGAEVAMTIGSGGAWNAADVIEFRILSGTLNTINDVITTVKPANFAGGAVSTYQYFSFTGIMTATTAFTLRVNYTASIAGTPSQRGIYLPSVWLQKIA